LAITAKTVSVKVRASASALLCFETGGILGERSPKFDLGATIPAFDFAGFYATLGSMPTVPGHPARLIYDFLEIQGFVDSFWIAALRAENRKAALSKAINARANAFYSKYANAPAIIARMNQLYSPTVAGSKPNRLDILASISEDQMKALNDAYGKAGYTDVVPYTLSMLNSNTYQQENQESVNFPTSDSTFSSPPVGDGLNIVGADAILKAGKVLENFEMGSSTAAQRETIINYGYTFRFPILENNAQYHRAQISLIDQQFAEFMKGQNLPYLDAVFQNELTSIDSDVYQIQIAFLNTILMSPMAGTITGIYKNPGDAVRPGEPVIRVENNEQILLHATLIYRGPIAVGSTATVSTALFDPATPSVTLTGPVLAVRGTATDDRWEVVIRCNNLDAGGKPLLPIGYNFDSAYDGTTVSFS
jgi:hypothetical protein